MSHSKGEQSRRQALEDKLKREEEARKLTAQQEQQEQQIIPQKQEVTVVSDDKEVLNAMVTAYQEQFKTDDGYEEGYADPSKREDGRFSFSFPSDEKAVEFFSAQAKNNQSFILVNEENQVLAYSDGKGTMCHANGDEFQKGDIFKPSDDPSLDQVKANMNSSSMQY
jgi:hypothetical protein